ncbi:3-hydroxyacyl-CoA dehydrogenase NAD-binding domain-containing protein [Thioalkalivibrio sp. HK1]|uniref:3-hydroxyacyl-CoA dehydrogenase NAD-binding domain-containing protein n=1 Tax=Thioalkalivibrio sp. HK1 TaxID=1469245 RepID=UPI000472A8AE|nr:3-hydroxyacyl-CoA dehydrogenase NAD-binding domain-containing protein [Thioalkalivibrio sp. HK1]
MNIDDLPAQSTIKRIAVIGTGTIGASWAAYFLARGFEVRAWDPAPDAESTLRDFIHRAWPTLERLGSVEAGADSNRMRFCKSPGEAVAEADFVQESAPEDLDAKRRLYADIDASLPPSAVLASSTSGLSMSKIQAGFDAASRFVVGHPFNPPHLIPLVEVVGGEKTAPAAVDWTLDFYNAHGKKAIRLNHESPGHLVNRLQAALWREAMDAVLTGLAGVEDVDIAIKYGPGLRFGIMGPFELCHLAGGAPSGTGAGGFSGFIDHFGDGLQSWMDDLREVRLDPDVRSRLKTLVEESVGRRDFKDIAGERDALLMATMIAARTRREEGFER